MKFVADVMLGSLAKKMRFAGYDVLYDNSADDETLKRLSRDRMLLTRDRPLAKQVSKNRVYLVQSSGADRQMTEIRTRFPMKRMRARCIECNAELTRIPKSKLQHLVPPFVWKQQEHFFRCDDCSRIYWTGTHYQNMLRMLK
jgi:uncharacterized protein